MDEIVIIEQQPIIALKRIRIAAAIIDFLTIWITAFILGIFWGDWHKDSEGLGVKLYGFGKIGLVIAWFLFFPVSEGMYGQTLGKRALKITVIRQNLNPTNIGTSLIRHLLDPIDLILFIGLLVATLNKKKKRIGDFFAGTLVVTKN